MKITDAGKTNRQLSSVLQSGTVTSAIVEAARWVDPSLTVSRGTTEYHFKLGRDGVWRFVSTNSYGGYSGVYGEGCDASGFHVSTAVAIRLNALLDARR